MLGCRVQDFPEIDLNRGITQQVLRELFHSKQMGAHATSWDTTFRGCTVLADVPGQTEKSTSAIHWRFSAPPLARRELVYLIAEQDFESEAGVKRTLYGYISVSDQWLNDVTGCVVEQSNHVRSANMFPTCDRLTVLDGGRLLRVEHLMTTKLSGLIPSWAYNTLFSAALKKANAHEADLVKAYVEQTANARLEDQIASGTI